MEKQSGELEQAVRRALHEVVNFDTPREKVGAYVWTNQIRFHLHKEGLKQQYTALPRPNNDTPPANRDEWRKLPFKGSVLYDAVWRGNKGEFLMVMESELHGQVNRKVRQQEDLDKLIQSRALLRVFLFRAGTLDAAKTRISELKQYIGSSPHSRSEDRYLLIARNESISTDNGFCFVRHVVGRVLLPG